MNNEELKELYEFAKEILIGKTFVAEKAQTNLPIGFTGNEAIIGDLTIVDYKLYLISYCTHSIANLDIDNIINLKLINLLRGQKLESYGGFCYIKEYKEHPIIVTPLYDVIISEDKKTLFTFTEWDNKDIKSLRAEVNNLIKQGGMEQSVINLYRTNEKCIKVMRELIKEYDKRKLITSKKLPLELKTIRSELIGRRFTDCRSSTSFIITNIEKSKRYTDNDFDIFSRDGMKRTLKYKVLESLVLNGNCNGYYYVEEL